MTTVVMTNVSGEKKIYNVTINALILQHFAANLTTTTVVQQFAANLQHHDGTTRVPDFPNQAPLRFTK